MAIATTTIDVPGCLSCTGAVVAAAVAACGYSKPLVPAQLLLLLLLLLLIILQLSLLVPVFVAVFVVIAAVLVAAAVVVGCGDGVSLL